MRHKADFIFVLIMFIISSCSALALFVFSIQVFLDGLWFQGIVRLVCGIMAAGYSYILAIILKSIFDE